MSLSDPSVTTYNTANFTPAELSRIIEMAWEDRTPFEAIAHSFGLNESAVVQLMRRELKSSSFRMWRRRMAGRGTKHQQLRSPGISRAYCPSQYKR
ncbi:TIGR03643 family protein [Rheinheimera sp. SA_1]|uniref:TIGR03643 family protein n=1 Tax=Rheinheimera sp. SA_1 TaxID=1827365 RepID=UPI0009EDAD5E|nr:TIGR03643 family protein [Rheinheimera sp. SA_1]